MDTMPHSHGEASQAPQLMNAVRLHETSGPTGLVYEQIEIPQPQTGQVLVRVHAAAITRGELDWPLHRVPAIPSYEFSGVVSVTGQGVERFMVGDAVYALSAFDRDGAAADYIVVSPDHLAHTPKTLSHMESASIPLAGLTAWQGLFDHGHLTKGQRVLVHGATGGVGHLAVQLAHWQGAYVIGTVSARHVAGARKLRVDEVIEHPAGRFDELVAPVDLVFDTVGGERLQRSLSVVRPGGRLVSVAADPSQEQAAARGITALYFVVAPNGTQLAGLTKLVDNGELRPAVAEVYPLAHARQAFERSLTAHPDGKIVLRITDE